jgi:hypothetical protein
LFSEEESSPEEEVDLEAQRLQERRPGKINKIFNNEKLITERKKQLFVWT